jgi:hypothetical protein
MNRQWLALLLSPIGLILISAGRLLIISNYSTTTATTIASSGGYVNTLLGSLIPLVPVFIPWIALLLLLFRHFLLSALTFVFTAFIAPTSLLFPTTRRLATADTHQLVARIGANQILTVAIALLIGIVCYLYLRSIAETIATLLLLAAAVALLSAPVIQDLYLPTSLRSANSDEGRIVSFSHRMVTSPLGDTVHSVIVITFVALIIAVVAANLIGLWVGWPVPFEATLNGISSLTKSLPEIVTIMAALLIAVAFFPYIYNMYPIPHRTEYYVGILRSPWLPAEKFSLSSGRSYYGYALSTDQDWFVILLSKTRKIIYVPAHEVIHQAVCQTVSERQLPVEAPLITTFYAPPPVIRDCASRKYLRNKPT